MSPPGRPKGETPSAQREGSPMLPPGRPKGETPSAWREGSPTSLLVIDAGNTAVKWAISDHSGRHLVGSGVQEHGSVTDLQARLAAAWTSLTPTAVYGVSVADPSVVHAIERAARTVGGLPVTWFETQRMFEARGVAQPATLRNGYLSPAQLGADRWHGMIAACSTYPGESLIIVSAGTATTVDCVRAEPPAAAVFLGGAIAPGFELMRLALARGTARLPLVEEDAATVAPLPYPATTEAAIAAGVFFAQLGLVERVVREFSAELRHAQRQPPRLLLTGGRGRALLGPLTRSLLPVAAVSALSLENDLILRGVALRALSERAPSPAEPTATGPAASGATLTSR
jgi:type III pantothenate kinase